MVHPQYSSNKAGRNDKFKALLPEQMDAIEGEIMALLHASRDSMRNKGEDTRSTPFNVNNAYYGEAYGVLRGMAVLGYGYFGAANVPAPNNDPRVNFNYWIAKLELQVLDDEGFNSDHKCAYCSNRYGKDDSTTQQ